MDRRDFLKTTGSAAAVAATIAVPAANAITQEDAKHTPSLSSGAKEIRVAITWPDGGQGPADSARRLARRLELATAGRYRLTFVATQKCAIATVAAGEADAYHASEHDNFATHRGFSFFAGLPGHNGLRPSALDAWMMAGGGQALWDELAAEHGIKALLAGHTGRSTGLWCRRPLHSANDLSGQSIWTMGPARDVVRGLGANAADQSPAMLAGALASDAVSAADTGGAITSLALGVMREAPNAQRISINPMGTALSLGVSRSLWDAMSASDQAIISAVCAAEFHATIAEEKAHRAVLMAPFNKPRGDTPELRSLATTISHVADAVAAHLAAHDARTQRINASYVAFRRAIGIRPSHAAAPADDRRMS